MNDARRNAGHAVNTPGSSHREGFSLSMPERIGYGSGSLATATYAVVPGLVLLYYLTTILGVTAAVAGIVVFLPKLLDLVCHPIVGRLSDSTVSRLGPRRPWMIAGTIMLPGGFVSIFCSPFSGNAAAWWVAVALTLTGLGASMFTIPYSVLPAELGANAAERTSLTAWRMGFLGLAILVAGAVAPLLAAGEGGGTEGYRVMAVAMGCVILLGTCGALYSARQSTHIPTESPKQAAGSLREVLIGARHNHPFRILLSVFMLIEVVISVTLAGLPYIADQILGTESAITPLFVCVVGPLMLAMPAWRHAARRIGKKYCLMAALTLFTTGALGVVVLPAVTEAIRLEICCALFLVAGTGFAGAQLMPQAMFADILANDAAESGQQRAGALAGLWSAGETIAAAAGAGVYAFVLAASGFVSSRAGESVVQPESAQWGIVFGFSGISGISIIAALILTTRYAPTEGRVHQSKIALRV
ncbi:MFS transporter [Nocardia amamiensis]|uniref:MFS transporter n=1 Tax=Nocardia TaxID=1817 RepID=UPI0033C05271